MLMLDNTDLTDGVGSSYRCTVKAGIKGIFDFGDFLRKLYDMVWQVGHLTQIDKANTWASWFLGINFGYLFGPAKFTANITVFTVLSSSFHSSVMMTVRGMVLSVYSAVLI